jgi:hypothetical protein
MKISESIEAHQSAAVAAISQRNQATLPGFHKIFLISVFNRLYRLAKASGFCLCFYRSFDALRLLRMTLNSELRLLRMTLNGELRLFNMTQSMKQAFQNPVILSQFDKHRMNPTSSVILSQFDKLRMNPTSSVILSQFDKLRMNPTSSVILSGVRSTESKNLYEAFNLTPRANYEQ